MIVVALLITSICLDNLEHVVEPDPLDNLLFPYLYKLIINIKIKVYSYFYSFTDLIDQIYDELYKNSFKLFKFEKF